MLGYSRADILAMGVQDVVHPDEAPRFAGALALLLGGKLTTSEWRFRRKGGSIFPGEVVCRQLPDGSFQGILRDISVRRRMEEELDRERVLLANVAAATDVKLVFLDLDFNFLWVNQAYADTCRMTPGEMIGRNHFALYPDENTEAIFRQVRDSGEPVFFKDRSFEFPDQPERGTTYWDWSLIAARDQQGKISGLVFSLSETTSYVRTRQALNQSDERYRRLFQNMDEGVVLHEVISDADGLPTDCRFLEVNAAFERLTGLSRSEVLGKRLIEVIPEMADCWLGKYREIAATGEPARFDRFAETLGRRYEIRAYQSAPRQFATIFNDVTQLQETARALGEAKLAAECANRAKSVFLANMSHEIRTPMHVIMGLGHLLRRTADKPEDKERLDLICATSEHLHEIINDVLDLSKIEAGEFAIEHADFRLDKVLDRVLRMIGERAESRGLALIVDISPPLRAMALNGDALRLTQVLINLGANAIKFTDRGTVRLSVTSLAEDADQVRLCFKVADTGIGIDPADLRRIFRPFTQADDSSTRERGGSGLGLAICQRILALMGSTIQVESTPGEGSTFSFELSLPRARAEIIDAEESAVLPVAHRFSSRPRVLFAEDHPVSQDILFAMLEELGCEVEVASDGVEAVECAQDRRYDLILMDMQMPRMDGLDATRAIRALPGCQDVPIIALTANAFADDRQRCLDAGMNGHLDKPVTLMALARKLGRWLAEQPVSAHGETSVEIPGGQPGSCLRGAPEHEQLLRRFVQLHGQDMALLRQHLAAGEREAASRIAHDLKGIAGLLGEKNIASLANDIVLALRAKAETAVIAELADHCAGELELLAEAAGITSPRNCDAHAEADLPNIV